MEDLLLLNDPDYAAYQAGDPAFILRATGDAIRAYCGWHIGPNITETVEKLAVGSRGIVLLPSLYVTDVSEVWITGHPSEPAYLQDPNSYAWFPAGYIEPVNPASFRSMSGYYYEPGPVFLPTHNFGTATVTLSHGYSPIPDDIKMVAYELAASASAMLGDGSSSGGISVLPGGIKGISSPGFSVQLGGSATTATSMGMNLNPDQKKRLDRYCIGRTK